MEAQEAENGGRAKGRSHRGDGEARAPSAGDAKQSRGVINARPVGRHQDRGRAPKTEAATREAQGGQEGGRRRGEETPADAGEVSIIVVVVFDERGRINTAPGKRNAGKEREANSAVV